MNHNRQIPAWLLVCTKIKNPWQTLSRVFPCGAKYFSAAFSVFFRSPLEYKEFQRVQGYGMVKKKATPWGAAENICRNLLTWTWGAFGVLGLVSSEVRKLRECGGAIRVLSGARLLPRLRDNRPSTSGLSGFYFQDVALKTVEGNPAFVKLPLSYYAKFAWVIFGAKKPRKFLG